MALRHAFAGFALAIAQTSGAAASVPMVFFEWNSAEVSPQAAAMLDSILRQGSEVGHSRLRLSGNSDRSGPQSYNSRLSLSRAEAVRTYLVSRGVPTSRLETVSWGEDHPIVETQDGVRERQNRYVLIEFLP